MVIDDGLNAYVYEETSTIATECPSAEVGAAKRPTRAVPRSVAMAPATARDLSGRPRIDRAGRPAAGLIGCRNSMSSVRSNVPSRMRAHRLRRVTTTRRRSVAEAQGIACE